MIDIIVYISEDTGDSVRPVAYKVIRNTNNFECWFFGRPISPLTVPETVTVLDSRIKAPKSLFTAPNYNIIFNSSKRVLICGNVSTAPF